jgi:hypothetical protein
MRKRHTITDAKKAHRTLTLLMLLKRLKEWPIVSTCPSASLTGLSVLLDHVKYYSHCAKEGHFGRTSLADLRQGRSPTSLASAAMARHLYGITAVGYT